MRNPLSAIIQSAESILSIIVGSAQKNDDDHKAILDAAEIINLCAQHQKKIVDDLLTLSKLDAKLLLISPEKVDPINILHKMVQMYEGELQSTGIKTELVVDQTLSNMAIDEVTIDPSRLLQVSKYSLDRTPAKPIGTDQYFHECLKIHEELFNAQNHSHALCFILPSHSRPLWRIVRAFSFPPYVRPGG
jgi:hypothetical protein